MKKRRTARDSRPQTIRLEPESSRIVEAYAAATGWSSSKVINRLAIVAIDALQGNKTGGALLKEQMAIAAKLQEERQASERRQAELRKCERNIAAKLPPVHLAELPVEKKKGGS